MPTGEGGANGVSIVARTANGHVMRAFIIVICVVFLSTTAAVLARTYHTRRAERAVHAFSEGRTKLAQGRTVDAVAALRASVALDPSQLPSRLELANALVSLGRPNEATSYLRDVLRDDPVNGPANLAMARIQRSLGRLADAESFYYRAIYGLWGPDEQAARVDVRMELIALLRETADRTRVRSELTQLANAFPGDLPLQLRVGRALMDSGYPDDAAAVYKAVTERFAQPGTAFEGLADAEFARRNYVAAFDAAQHALTLHPTDPHARARRDLAGAILALDPTLPRLSNRERSVRLRNLMTLARARLSSCRELERAPGGADLLPVLDRWLASDRGRQLEGGDVGMALLAAAARRVTQACPPPRDSEPLDYVLRQLAQESRS